MVDQCSSAAVQALRPLPTDWALTGRPVFSDDERRVYRQLREALPHHIVLSKLPLVRFCQPEGPGDGALLVQNCWAALMSPLRSAAPTGECWRRSTSHKILPDKVARHRSSRRCWAPAGPILEMPGRSAFRQCLSCSCWFPITRLLHGPAAGTRGAPGPRDAGHRRGFRRRERTTLWQDSERSTTRSLRQTVGRSPPARWVHWPMRQTPTARRRNPRTCSTLWAWTTCAAAHP